MRNLKLSLILWTLALACRVACDGSEDWRVELDQRSLQSRGLNNDAKTLMKELEDQRFEAVDEKLQKDGKIVHRYLINYTCKIGLLYHQIERKTGTIEFDAMI